MKSKLKIISTALFTGLVLSACTFPGNTPPPTSSSLPEPQATSLPADPNTQPPTGEKTTNFYTLADVAAHASAPDDCWLVIDGKVYDVSGFGEKHGGGEAIYQGCGQDATTLFETRPMGSKTPHSDKARSFLPNFLIGELTE